ncbi:hypothetical protein [uncultured Cetobacterium sp.]|uniref:hypothetical protein n=1 Tax=uncultured Cetobacterium sp. TaxID=527638 RepID=UPI00260FDC63|nr:hypothetical protein [uncultured Cetobacterium sp.]
MKKVLLGLLALSATLMATTTPSTGVADGNGGNRIDINTKAFIVDSGLIITGSSGAAIKSVELDHGTIMVGANTLPAVSKEVFIRKSNKQAFPINSILEISLAGNSNLAHSGNSRIPHTLTATIDSGAASATNSSNVLTISDTGDTADTKTNQFSTTNGATAVKVALQSTIAPSTVTSGLTEGEYNNKSTLSVKFSKIPSTSNNETAVESQPAGTSR